MSLCLSTFALSVGLTALTLQGTATAQGVTHRFDQFSTGQFLGEVYEPWGVTLFGERLGQILTVVADEPCDNLTPASSPNVISLRFPSECPDFTDIDGHIVAEFALGQTRVSFTVTFLSENSSAILEAYDDQGRLVEMGFLNGVLLNGVPTPIEVSDPQPRIWRVEVYAPTGGGGIVVDDLSYDILPVPTTSVRWSTIKANYRRP